MSTDRLAEDLTIARAALGVSRQLDLQAVAEALVRASMDLGRATSAFLYLYDGEQDTFHLKASHIPPEDPRRKGLLTLDLVLPGEQSPQLPRGAAPLAEPLAFLHRAPPFVEPLGLPPFQPFARLARRFAGVEIPLVAKPPSRPNATAAGFFFLAMLITSIPGPMYYSAVGFSTGRDFPEFPQRCNLTHRS